MTRDYQFSLQQNCSFISHNYLNINIIMIYINKHNISDIINIKYSLPKFGILSKVIH